MVGWGDGWPNCIVTYTFEIQPTTLLWWQAYTNTQTCSYTVHTAYMYTYSTHAHICIYACASMTHGSDPATVTYQWDTEAKWTLAGPRTVWFIISKVHWESWWDCENVAPSPLFYFFSGMFSFCCCSKKPLHAVVICNVTNICFVYLAFKLHTTPQRQLFVLFLFFFSFLWSDAFLSKQ